MRKRRIERGAHQPPAIARAHAASLGVDAITKGAHEYHILPCREHPTLAGQTLRMRDVVGIHPRDEWRTSVTDDVVGTARRSECLRRLEEPDPAVATGPLTEGRG